MQGQHPQVECFLSKPLLTVSARHNANSLDPGTGQQAQAAFWMPAFTKLRLPPDHSNRMTSDYLAHHVARFPADLRSHVQRINLHIQSSGTDEVYGALLDLFIILGQRGRPLRERMLKGARKVLGSAHSSSLHQQLENGITALDPMPLSTASMLSKGCQANRRLIERKQARRIEEQDPLEGARDHLEYGPIDEARQVLESALLKEPDRPELHHDLLEIYKRTNARKAFLTMRRRLDISTHAAEEAWRELAAFFEVED